MRELLADADFVAEEFGHPLAVEDVGADDLHGSNRVKFLVPNLEHPGHTAPAQLLEHLEAIGDYVAYFELPGRIGLFALTRGLLGCHTGLPQNRVPAMPHGRQDPRARTERKTPGNGRRFPLQTRITTTPSRGCRCMNPRELLSYFGGAS
jgi:hypothetical protein